MQKSHKLTYCSWGLNIAMVMSSLPWSLAPIAYLAFPPWWPVRRGPRSLCWAATDPIVDIISLFADLLSLVVCSVYMFSPAVSEV